MAGKLKRRKVADGDYEIVDAEGTVVATVQEWGKSGYRWRVEPSAFTWLKGWDTNSISDAVATLEGALR